MREVEDDLARTVLNQQGRIRSAGFDVANTVTLAEYLCDWLEKICRDSYDVEIVTFEAYRVSDLRIRRSDLDHGAALPDLLAEGNLTRPTKAPVPGARYF